MSDGSGVGKKVIIFCADISLSVDIDYTKKDVLILGKGTTQGLDDTAFTAAAKYSIHFSEQYKTNRFSLHCNGTNSFLFFNGVKSINSR